MFWKILTGFCLGLGVLSKGPAMLVISSPIPVYLVLTRGVRKYCLTPAFLVSFLAFLGIGSSWYIAVVNSVPGAFAYLWDNQVSGRFFSGKYTRNPGPLAPFCVYLPTILLGTLPWSVVWYPQLYRMWKHHAGKRGAFDRVKKKPQLFLAVWVAFPLLVFCISSSRLPLYLLPLFAPLSMITARCWISWKPLWFERGKAKRVLTVFLLWSLLIMGLREAVALFPTRRDTRAVWMEMKDCLPKSRYEIVVVNHHRHGLGFYCEGNVERVTTSTHPYPTFHMPGRLEEEIHELPTCLHYHVFLVADKHESMLRDILRSHHAVFKECDVTTEYRLFIVDPAPVEDWAVRMAVLGGTGPGDSTQVQLGSALNQVDETRPLDGIVLLGGHAADRDPTDSFQDDFLQPYDALIHNGVEFFSVLGEKSEGERNVGFELAQPLFHMNGQRYYSDVFGDNLVQVFFLDSNDLLPGGAQVSWLTKSLKSSAAKWKVVAMHGQVYGSEPHDPNPETSLRGILEPIFLKYGVRIVMAGHTNGYQRLKPQEGIHCFSVSNSVGSDSDRPDDSNLVVKEVQENVALILQFSQEQCNFKAIDGLENEIDRGEIPFSENASFTQNDNNSGADRLIYPSRESCGLSSFSD